MATTDMEEAFEQFLREQHVVLPNPQAMLDPIDLETIFGHFLRYCVNRGLKQATESSWLRLFERLGIDAGDGMEKVSLFWSKVPAE